MESVKNAMEESVQVFYIGDRDTFTFDSSESYLEELSSDAKENNEDDSSSSTPLWPILVGFSAGIVAMVGAAVLYKKRASTRVDDNNEPSSVVEALDEELELVEDPQPQEEEATEPQEEDVSPQEEEEPREDYFDLVAMGPGDEESKAVGMMGTGFDYTEVNCTAPTACDFLGVLGRGCDS